MKTGDIEILENNHVRIYVGPNKYFIWKLYFQKNKLVCYLHMSTAPINEYEDAVIFAAIECNIEKLLGKPGQVLEAPENFEEIVLTLEIFD